MEVYRHQVGGHSRLMKPQDSSKVFKPFSDSEHRFYEKLVALGSTSTDSGPLHVLKQFVPKYFGLTEVQVQTTVVAPASPLNIRRPQSPTTKSAECSIASSSENHSSSGNQEQDKLGINSLHGTNETLASCGVQASLIPDGHSPVSRSRNSLTAADYVPSVSNLVQKSSVVPSLVTDNSTQRSKRVSEETLISDKFSVGDSHLTVKQYENLCLSSSSKTIMNNSKSSSLKYIVLEDLVYLYKKPCVMDVKMGRRQRKIGASPEKEQRQLDKSLKTTSNALGFRLCGCQFYDKKNDTLCYRDKYWGRKLPKDKLLQSIGQWFWNGYIVYHELILPLINSLKILYTCISELRHYRFWSSSLLWVYDGGLADSKARVQSLDVRMIDFANTIILKDQPSPDDEYLFGLRNVISILEKLACSTTTAVPPAFPPANSLSRGGVDPHNHGRSSNPYALTLVDDFCPTPLVDTHDTSMFLHSQQSIVDPSPNISSTTSYISSKVSIDVTPPSELSSLPSALDIIQNSAQHVVVQNSTKPAVELRGLRFKIKHRRSGGGLLAKLHQKRQSVSGTGTFISSNKHRVNTNKNNLPLMKQQPLFKFNMISSSTPLQNESNNDKHSSNFVTTNNFINQINVYQGSNTFLDYTNPSTTGIESNLDFLQLTANSFTNSQLPVVCPNKTTDMASFKKPLKKMHMTPQQFNNKHNPTKLLNQSSKLHNLSSPNKFPICTSKQDNDPTLSPHRRLRNINGRRVSDHVGNKKSQIIQLHDRKKNRSSSVPIISDYSFHDKNNYSLGLAISKYQNHLAGWDFLVGKSPTKRRHSGWQTVNISEDDNELHNEEDRQADAEHEGCKADAEDSGYEEEYEKIEQDQIFTQKTKWPISSLKFERRRGSLPCNIEFDSSGSNPSQHTLDFSIHDKLPFQSNNDMNTITLPIDTGSKMSEDINVNFMKKKWNQSLKDNIYIQTVISENNLKSEEIQNTHEKHPLVAPIIPVLQNCNVDFSQVLSATQNYPESSLQYQPTTHVSSSADAYEVFSQSKPIKEHLFTNLPDLPPAEPFALKDSRAAIHNIPALATSTWNSRCESACHLVDKTPLQSIRCNIDEKKKIENLKHQKEKNGDHAPKHIKRQHQKSRSHEKVRGRIPLIFRDTTGPQVFPEKLGIGSEEGMPQLNQRSFASSPSLFLADSRLETIEIKPEKAFHKDNCSSRAMSCGKAKRMVLVPPVIQHAAQSIKKIDYCKNSATASRNDNIRLTSVDYSVYSTLRSQSDNNLRIMTKFILPVRKPSFSMSQPPIKRSIGIHYSRRLSDVPRSLSDPTSFQSHSTSLPVAFNDSFALSRTNQISFNNPQYNIQRSSGGAFPSDIPSVCNINLLSEHSDLHIEPLVNVANTTTGPGLHQQLIKPEKTRHGEKALGAFTLPSTITGIQVYGSEFDGSSFYSSSGDDLVNQGDIDSDTQEESRKVIRKPRPRRRYDD